MLRSTHPDRALIEGADCYQFASVTLLISNELQAMLVALRTIFHHRTMGSVKSIIG